MGKEEQLSIWGVRAGLIGDLVMALPILEYLEKKYPGSYKYWAVHQKCAQAAPLFLNHPLIDRIKITDGWVSEGERDNEIKKQCKVVFDISPPCRDQNWRNEMDCITQTARMAGIDDLDEVIDDRIPYLDPWFPSYTFSNMPGNHGYIDNVSDTWNTGTVPKERRVAIWPFANYMMKPHRSPSQGWWEATVQLLINAGYLVYHYGWMTEPKLSDDNSRYRKFTNLSFFDQIRSSLEANVSIGTDSGSLWVLGAYGQQQIALMTFHEVGHKENPMALAPPYPWTEVLFNPSNINLIKPKEVLDKLETM